ncbi:MAG: nucleotidyl transferase AbiEii/AbiGii toxin family protein, partial [Candidatus Delongbacteria bacterium]|nr:nucleotidyl transferase AbiEii/AbiGii toxin family protein [Candidatus Delongbacteria bacterium]
MKLHEDNQLFNQAVLATAQFKKIPENYVEKDYWITYVLKLIFSSELSDQAVFKGGTPLEKCYNLINRFSEDIDVVVVRNKGESDAQLTKKIRTISKMVTTVLPEIKLGSVTNKRGKIRKTAHNYKKLYESDFGEIRDNIVLEVTWFGNAEPSIDKNVSCYIEEMMREKGQINYIERYELKPFM